MQHETGLERGHLGCQSLVAFLFPASRGIVRHARHARQGLVRVSESNTKYGGKRGITGVRAAPVIEPTIGESSGIPKPKFRPDCGSRVCAPLFTGELSIRVLQFYPQVASTRASKPSRFVADAKHAVDLMSAHTFVGGGHQVESKPLSKWDFGALEHGSNRT